MSNLRVLTLNDIRKFQPSQSVWLLNTTNSSPAMRRNKDPETREWKQERADVCLNIASSTIHGETETIIIPQSFLPVDATNFVTLRDLLDSRAFMRAVREGLITIIDEESANDLFNTAGADRERERLIEKEQKVREATSNRFIEKASVVNVSNPSSNSEEAPLPKAEVRAVTEIPHTIEDDFDATFVMNVMRWSELDSISVINGMRTAGKFTRRELNYVISKLDPVRHKSAIDYIKQVMAGKKKNLTKAK